MKKDFLKEKEIQVLRCSENMEVNKKNYVLCIAMHRRIDF